MSPAILADKTVEVDINFPGLRCQPTQCCHKGDTFLRFLVVTLVMHGNGDTGRIRLSRGCRMFDMFEGTHAYSGTPTHDVLFYPLSLEDYGAALNHVTSQFETSNTTFHSANDFDNLLISSSPVVQETTIQPDIDKNPGDGGSLTIAPVTVTATYNPGENFWQASGGGNASSGAGGGNVSQVEAQEHAAAAAQYVAHNVHVNYNTNDPNQTEVAKKYIQEIYATYYNALQDQGMSYTSSSGPTITLTDDSIVSAMQNIQFNINISNPEGNAAGYTTYTSTTTATIDLAVGANASGVGAEGYDMSGSTDPYGEGLIVNHELGHVLDGGDAFQNACLASYAQSSGNTQANDPNWAIDWPASSDFADNEAHANSVAEGIASLAGTDWYSDYNTTPPGGYWNGKT